MRPDAPIHYTIICPGCGERLEVGGDRIHICERDSRVTDSSQEVTETLYGALLAKFKRMGFSHAVADDLAERAADVARAWMASSRERDVEPEPADAVYPTALADLLAEAMRLWDEAGTQDPGEPEADPSLDECVENDWSLAAFLALYLQRRGVDIA